MNVLHEILNWSTQGDRPHWWRDALRRLVQHGSVDEKDIQKFVLMCKSAHNLTSPEETIKPEPLSKKHIPPSQNLPSSVSLLEIGDVTNVNAIKKGPPLRFAPKGITVVYGDNASGKSGYVRILKRICRARGAAEEVLPNVFGQSTTAPPSAHLKLLVDDEEVPFTWDNTSVPPEAGSLMSIFDAKGALQYVATKTDLAFRPFGLDLLDKLSDTCLKVRETLTAELEKVRAERTLVAKLLDRTTEGTEVHTVITGLTSRTSDQRLREIATLSEEQKRRLAMLQSQLAQIEAEGAVRRAQELRMRAQRLGTLAEFLHSLEQKLGERAIHRLHELGDEATTAIAAARTAAQDLFSAVPLPGVGSATWRALWEAARRYSEGEAYASRPFPVTDELSRCVLCQQPLIPEARKRLQGFEDFVKGETQQVATELQSKLGEKSEEVTALKIDIDNISGALEELKAENKNLGGKASSFVEEASKLADCILIALDTCNWDSVAPLSPWPHEELAETTKRVEEQAQTFEAAKDTEELAKLQQELAELSDRETLHRNFDEVLAEKAILGRIEKLDQCVKDTQTRSISVLSTQ